MSKITVFGYMFVDGELTLDCDVEVHGGFFNKEQVVITKNLYLPPLNIKTMNEGYEFLKGYGIGISHEASEELRRILNDEVDMNDN